ncbi:hypothetical protein LO763_03430 [Glycomyces sp. A-F 0318]|uniref:hypothetical protein n=1 Tax=Glycomyces amatae TaxID=2881355 RepID=UPI001E337AD4|nr:hypothetical protein [Glycomyces amatae]MCD0442675.1 hypothetical protein [Glycomyces amatae]
MTTASGFLKPCSAVAGAAAVVAAVIGWIAAGGTGAWAAPAGVALAALGFAGSAVAVMKAEKIDIRLTLPMALVTYAIKLMIVFMVLATVRFAFPEALPPFAYGIAGGAVAWLAAQVVWAYKAKIPYIELGDRS